MFLVGGGGGGGGCSAGGAQMGFDIVLRLPVLHWRRVVAAVGRAAVDTRVDYVRDTVVNGSVDERCGFEHLVFAGFERM